MSRAEQSGGAVPCRRQTRHWAIDVSKGTKARVSISIRKHLAEWQAPFRTRWAPSPSVADCNAEETIVGRAAASERRAGAR